jgi:MraZ protein
MVVTVAVNEQGCLWLYPLSEWEALELTISKSPTLNKIRFVIGNASEYEMDGHRQLLWPEKLRKFSQMDKRSVLVGQWHKFEM